MRGPVAQAASRTRAARPRTRAATRKVLMGKALLWVRRTLARALLRGVNGTAAYRRRSGRASGVHIAMTCNAPGLHHQPGRSTGQLSPLAVEAPVPAPFFWFFSQSRGNWMQ